MYHSVDCLLRLRCHGMQHASSLVHKANGIVSSREAERKKWNSLVITFPLNSQIKPERSTDYNLIQVSQFNGKTDGIVVGDKKKIVRIANCNEGNVKKETEEPVMRENP